MNGVSSLQPGYVVAGRYRIVGPIGRGGYGVVYAADDASLARRVALKLVSPQRALSPDAQQRFLREAQFCAQLTSEHVAHLLDAGADASLGPYLALELLEGVDLGALVRQQGPRPIEEAVVWMLEACEALAEAHARGIVHRDIKPSNLFLATRAGGRVVKVLDFGMARFVEDAEMLTMSGEVCGTPRYMAPEQLNGVRDIDARADVWSLCVTLYELIAGGPIFDAPGSAAFAAMVLTANPIPLRARVPNAPEELERVIMAGLEKDRTRRMPSVVDFARAVAPFTPDGARLAARVAAVAARAPSMLSSSGVGVTEGPTWTDNAPRGAQGSFAPPPRTSHAPVPLASAPPFAQPPQTPYGGTPYGGTPYGGTPLRGTPLGESAPRASKAPLVIGVGGVALLAIAGLTYGGYRYANSGSTASAAAAAAAAPDAAALATNLSLAASDAGPAAAVALAAGARSAPSPRPTPPLAGRDSGAPAPILPARDAGQTPPAPSTCNPGGGFFATADCGSGCERINIDSRCGGCSKKCSGAEHCRNQADNSWTCAPCPEGTRFCSYSASCANTDTDLMNCGGCGHLCKAGAEICSAGQCVDPRKTH